MPPFVPQTRDRPAAMTVTAVEKAEIVDNGYKIKSHTAPGVSCTYNSILKLKIDFAKKLKETTEEPLQSSLFSKLEIN